MKINPIHTKVLNAVRNQGGADSAPPLYFCSFIQLIIRFLFTFETSIVFFLCANALCASLCARACVCVCVCERAHRGRISLCTR